MEIDKSDTEKILDYLHTNLQGHPIIDAIVAGIFLSEDFNKMDKILDLMKRSRSMMDQRRLKKEEEIILFDKMIQQLYQHKNGDIPSSDSASEVPVPAPEHKPNKREVKSKRIEEEKEEEKAELEPIRPKPVHTTNELQNLIDKHDENSIVKSFTIEWTWDQLMNCIRQKFLSKKSTDCLEPQKPVGVDCSICKKSMDKENCIINTSWKHIYHPKCLISHCREYLEKCQYPRNCPSRGCKKILGPQEITKHLDPEEYIKFEAFSLQRSGQKSRKQLLWCKTCHIVFAIGYDETLENCRYWHTPPYKFQDVLKHLDANAKFSDSERLEANSLYQIFIQDWHGIVERWSICLKRRIKISGYKYEICICDKVSKTIRQTESQQQIN